MARRNVNNPRYQKDAKIGSTRKSAAAAKPKRSAGDRSTTGSGPKPKKQRRFEQLNTPEIKAQRKRWWFFILAALGAAGILMIPAVNTNPTYSSIAFGVWGACFATALYIEFFLIRKLRKAETVRLKKEAKSA